MSFGIPGYDRDIARAITDVGNVIMFAAASNGGKNRPRTYPATDTKVIAVHAMSGNGDEGSINPTTEHQHDHLGTLGLGIRLRWRNEATYKNGTSYATPIAAGIAANWLEWLNYVAKDPSCGVTELQHATWGSPYGIRNIFTKVMSQRHHDLLYVAPWHLWNPDKKDLTDRDIIGRLNTTPGL